MKTKSRPAAVESDMETSDDDFIDPSMDIYFKKNEKTAGSNDLKKPTRSKEDSKSKKTKKDETSEVDDDDDDDNDYDENGFEMASNSEGDEESEDKPQDEEESDVDMVEEEEEEGEEEDDSKETVASEEDGREKLTLKKIQQWSKKLAVKYFTFLCLLALMPLLLLNNFIY